MKKLLMVVMVLAAGMAAWGDEAAFAHASGATMRLDTRTGTRIAAKGASETIAYSPKWGGAASCTVTADGTMLKTASAEGTVAWSPTTTGAHTLTHTAGSVAYMAQFTVLGDDVTQHAGALAASETWASNTVHLVTADVTVPSGKTLTIEPGAVVKFMTGTSLTATGTCMANGVIFTHVNDDTAGGDTLMNGDAEKPVVDAYKIDGNVNGDDATEYRYVAPQELASTISSTTRLRGHTVYLANSSITVNSGVTLTLLPGAIIKFANGCSMTVNGTLDAQGTRAAPIVFTSAKDDDWGGDTNGDGDRTRPEGGNWTGLYVNGTANLAYCIAMYAAPSNERGNIECRSGGRLTMNGCTVAHSLYDGVWNWGGTIKITNSIFFDCGNAVCPYQGSTECDNCVMFECNYGYMDWSHWVGGTFRNCVFYGMGMNWSDTNGAAEFQSHSTVKSCCFYNPEEYAKRSCTKNGVDGNIYANPKFVDPDNGDFRIAANSPCVDAGDGTVAPELDYYGQPRRGIPDIGIYEVTDGLLSAVDLVPEQVSLDSRAVPGGELHVTWEVRNIGSEEVTGSWRDKIVLTDATGSYSIDLGTVISSGTISPGGSLACSAVVVVPATAEGVWRVAVHVNCERDIFEGQNTTNNVSISSGTVAVAMVAAEPDAGMTGTADANKPGVGKFVFSGEPMIGRIDAPEGTIVYFGDGFVPTADSYSARTVCGTNGGIIGIPAGTTTGYLTVVSPNGKAVAYSLSFVSGALAVKSASPGSVPSSGKTGVKVMGANFAEGCVAELLTGGVVCAGAVEKTTCVSATELVLALDCDKLQAGRSYAVRVRTADGETAVLDKAVTVASAPPKAALKAKLDVPSTVRQGRTITAFVDYENTGNVDMPAPIFEIVSEGQIFKVDGRLYTNSVKVVGLAAEAPHGTLRPGEPQRLAVQVTCMAADVKWKLKSYHAAQEGAKTAKFSLRELYDDDWVLYHVEKVDQTIDNLQEVMGPSWADFYASFSEWINVAEIDLIDYETLKGQFAREKYVDAIEIGQSAAKTMLLGQRDALLLSEPPQAAEPCAGHDVVWKPETGKKCTLEVNGSVWKWCRACNHWALLVSTDETDVRAEYIKTQDGEMFNPSLDTYLICHGNANSIDEKWIHTMADNLPYSANILAVNWGRGANRLITEPHLSARYIPETVDNAVAELSKLSVRPSNMTLIGHSHGSHVCANIAVNLSGGKFRRMVGLDTSTADLGIHGLNRMHPRDWLPHIRQCCEQVEFYKSSWNLSLEESSEVYGHYNFVLVNGEGDFFEKTWMKGIGRHGYSCDWFNATIENAGGIYNNLGFNFTPKSWNAIAGNNGTKDIPYPQETALKERIFAGVIRGHNVELLSGIRSGDKHDGCRYSETVLNSQKWLNEEKSMRQIFNRVAASVDYRLDPSKQPRIVRSGSDLELKVANDADNKSIPYESVGIFKGDNENEAMPWGRDSRYAVWIVDLEGLRQINATASLVSDWEKVTLDELKGYVVASAEEQLVRCLGDAKITSPANLFRTDHTFTLPGQFDRTKSVNIQKFNNYIFGEDKPLVYIDENKETQRRPVLLVYGAGVKARTNGLPTVDEWDLYSGDNVVIVRGLVEPDGVIPVISKKEIAKTMLLSANAKLASVQRSLSANALRNGEVVPVMTDKSGNWSIGLDGSESFRTDGEELTIHSFTLESTASAGGTVGLNGGKLRVDMPSVAVSGILSTDKEGEMYTVKLTVVGEEDESSAICVLDVRRPEDKDEGKDEDAVGSSSPKSCDPNEMSGSEGVGEQRLVKPGEWMNYTIYFENKADADASAAMVTVTNPLSEWLDWESFEMLDVAFGSQADTGLLGKSSGTSSVTMDGTNTSVRTEVAVDPATGVATWFLRIVDPDGDADGWPLDPYAGFLPPNDETHRGEGRISYRIKVREDAPGDVVITNSASIVFDYNEPIETDPAWWNTVTAGGEAGFAAAEQTVDEGGALKVVVNGGNMDLASSVQVQATYNTAAAADLDLKNTMVNGEKPKSFKFPVTLNWAAGEVGEKTIEIPVVVDKAVEADEMLTLQLVNPMNLTIAGSDGEGAVVTQGSACTVTIRDPGYGELKAKVAAGSATKAEADALAKADKVFAGKAYVRGLANDATRGKVAGSALAADGKNVTLKATANKGWVFAGWYTDAACTAGHELAGFGDYRNPSLAYMNTNGAVTVYARFIAPEEDSLALGEDFLPGEFAPGADCSIAVPVESVSYPTVKVTGLPAGMKFADKETLVKATKTTDAYTIAANTIYGAPTKAAAKPAVVTVTVKNLGGYQIVRQYEITVKEGMSPVETQARVVSEAAPYQSVAVDVADDFSGTISGAGVYQAGKKVTLKATANKGFVFSGWYEGEGLLTRAASFGFTMPSNDVSYVARFVTGEEDAASIATGLNGRTLDPAVAFATNVMAGVALQWPVAADALSQTTVTVSGLPAGLKFTANDVVDSKTKQVTVPANTIYGAPTAASKTDRSGAVTPSAVNVTATTAGKAKRVYPLALTVDPLPVWTVGTFNGPALLENVPNGLATLTIANTGKISGKLLTGGLTWSLAAGNFIDYSPTDGFLASLVGTSGKLAFTNELTVTTDALGGLAQSERFMAAQNNWKVEPWKSRAATFGKTAAVVMSVGGDQPGEISLKFATSGAVTAAGAFKTGVDAKGKDMVAKATCATAVCPDGAPDATGAFEASVFVYFPPKGAFAGYSACIRLRWDGTQFVVP